MTDEFEYKLEMGRACHRDRRNLNREWTHEFCNHFCNRGCVGFLIETGAGMKKSMGVQEIMDYARNYFKDVAHAGHAVPSDAILDKALEIVAETEENDPTFTGKAHRTRCAAAVYVALMLDSKRKQAFNGEYVTQRLLADAFSCTEVSIRNVYKATLKSYSARHVLEKPAQVYGWARKEIFKQ